MNRVQQILIGLLGLQLVLLLIFHAPFSGATASQPSAALLPATDLAAQRLEIAGRDGKQVRLAHGESGWTVPALDGFPADTAKVEALLNDLASVRLPRPLVTNRRYHERFKVADENHEVRLKVWRGSDTDPALDLILGDSSNYRTTYARVERDDAVYELRGLSTYQIPADAAAWVEKKLLDVPEDQITYLGLRNEHGTFALRREEGLWRVDSPEPDPPALDQQQVEALLRQAGSLTIAAPLGPAESGADPVATVELRWRPAGAETDQTAEVLLGPLLPDNDNQRKVTRSGFGFDATIWNSSVSGLIERRLDDLRSKTDGAG